MDALLRMDLLHDSPENSDDITPLPSIPSLKKSLRAVQKILSSKASINPIFNSNHLVHQHDFDALASILYDLLEKTKRMGPAASQTGGGALTRNMFALLHLRDPHLELCVAILKTIHQLAHLVIDKESLLVCVKEERSRLFGVEDGSVLKVMEELSLEYSSKMKWAEAEKILKELIHVDKRSFILGHKREYDYQLAEVLIAQSRFLEAEEILQGLISGGNSCQKSQSSRYVNWQQTLAQVYLDQEKWALAEELLLELDKRDMMDFPLVSGRAPYARLNLADALIGQEKWKEANRLVESGMSRLVFGEPGQKSLLAHLYAGQQRWAEAETILNETIHWKVWEETTTFRGGSIYDQFLFKDINTLAKVFIGLRRWADAEKLLSQAIQRSTTTKGTEHFGTLEILDILAECYTSQENWARAEPVLRVIVGVREKKPQGLLHPATLRSMEHLSRVHISMCHWQEAARLLEHVVTTREIALGLDHQLTFRCLKSLSLMYRKLGMWVEMDGTMRKILKARTR